MVIPLVKSKVQHHRFSSERVVEGWFDPSKGEIILKFPDGTLWWYRGCTMEVWNALVNAASQARFLSETLNFFKNGKV